MTKFTTGQLEAWAGLEPLAAIPYESGDELDCIAICAQPNLKMRGFTKEIAVVVDIGDIEKQKQFAAAFKSAPSLSRALLEAQMEIERLRAALKAIVDYAPAFYSHRERAPELISRSTGIYDSGILEGVGLCKDLARQALKGTNDDQPND